MQCFVRRSLVVLIASLMFPICSYGFQLPAPEKFHNGLSLQGFTGVLNTPSAHVTEDGYFYALYSNQKESKWRNKTDFQDNYLFSLGFYGFAEIGGRYFEAPGVGRDLSANVKLTTEPLFRNHPYVPVIALGMQDVGGGATFFNTKYAVISEDIWRLRLSAGYAGHGSGQYPTKGKFFGAELKAHDWVYLLSDYDTRETNVGMRVVTPQFWRIPISFTATAKSSLSHRPGNVDLAVGLNLPLDFELRKQRKPPTVAAVASDSALSPPQPAQLPAAVTAAAPEPGGEAKPAVPGSKADVPGLLRDRLVQAGFSNVRVGATKKGVLVVEYENARFNHNELDGVGVVAGIAASLAADDYDALRLVIRRHDIGMVGLTMPLRQARGFLNDGLPVSRFNEALAVSFDTSDDGAEFPAGKANPGWLKSSLMLYPGLGTFVGTEVGPFDYLLSLKPDLLVEAWKGAVVNARWDIPVSWSDNLDDGKIYRGSRHPARMERLMLFQALKPCSDFMVNLGAGAVLPHEYGTLNEATWSPGGGTHRFRAFQGFARDRATHQTITTYLGGYRYYYAPLDLSLEGTGGRFWAQDTGVSFDLKRFLGDTVVSLYYKNTKRADIDRRWQSVGIQLSFPLTFRRDMKHLYNVQVRGSDEWSYAQETTLTDSAHRANNLAPYPLAIDPQPATALYRAYYNRDRLSEAYIRGHLERLRDAWLKYREDL